MLENLIENTDYEWVELPSKGECYPHKNSRIPVAYLIAKDENIIASPKYIEKQAVCDKLLNLKILDNDFNPDNLCVGDRNAILIWLRRTGYGDTVIDSNTNQPIDLSTLKYKDFNLKGDENGYFDYLLENGDLIKYRLLTHNDEQSIINKSSDISEEYYNDLGMSVMIQSIVSYNGITDKNTCQDHICKLSNSQKEQFLKYILRNNPDFDFSGVEIAIDDSLFTDIIR